MNSQKYWRKRALLEKQKQLEASADYEAAMRFRLQQLENEFEKEAHKFVSLFANTNNMGLEQASRYLSSINTSKWDMTLAEFEAKARAGGYERELNSAYYKSCIARLQKLHDQFAKFAAKYAEKEEDRFALRLAKQYQDTYMMENYNRYLVVGGFDIDFASFDEQQLKNIVYQPWQGSNFSTRVWNNYTKVLPDMLTDSLLRGIVMGYSYARIERDIRNRYANFKKSNIHRLVITEMGHAAEEATAQFYEDSKIDKYQYLATLESRTCDQCGHLDSKIFNVKDRIEGLNYPLIHPYCRCTTVPYDETLPDIETRWSRDPVTGKGKSVKAMSFKEWKDKVVFQQDEREYNDFVKEHGVHGMPQSVNQYRNILYNKSTNRAMRAYMKARQKGMVEPVVTYQDYIDAMNRLNDEVVGIKASNGQTVKSFSNHIIDRIFGVRSNPQGHRREGVSIDEIEKMLNSNEIKNLKASTKFFSDQGYVVLNNKGNLVTVVPRKKKRKWKH